MKKSEPIRLLLTKTDLSQNLGVSVRLIEKWTAQGVIPALRPSPRMVRFELTRVLATLRKYETATLEK
jgi:predicted site-specific integrase-resolvase